MFHVESLVESLLHYNYKVLDKVRSLAIDGSLWQLWKTLLDGADEEWFYEDDEDIPPPEFSTLPHFINLAELKIVHNHLVGYWKQESRSDDVYEGDDFIDDDIEFLPISRSEFEDVTGHSLCECPLSRVQAGDPEWSIPVLGFLEKFRRGEV